MSTETLSQDPLEQTTGSVAPSGRRARPARATEVKGYDFRRPHRVSKERLLALEAMYERLVKSLEGWLVGRVRGKVELSLQTVEQVSFGEFTHSLPTPCAAYLFRIEDSGGIKGVIDFGHEFAYILVDRLFGGGGNPTLFSRALTPIERMAVRIVAERTTALLTEVWHDHVRLQLDLSGFESIPEILRAENRDDPMLVARVDIFAMGVQSMMAICLPLSVIEKFFSGSGKQHSTTNSGSERERQANRQMAENSLRATELEVAARLPEFRLSMRELASLRVGSVISTGVACDSELELQVSGRTRFRAVAGRVGRRLAVKIVATVESAPAIEKLPVPSRDPEI